MRKIQANQALKTQIQNWISAKKAQVDNQTSASPIPEHQGETKLIKWVDDKPVPVTERMLSSDHVHDLVSCAASLPYNAEDDFYDLFPELYGLSYLEVALIKLAQQAAGGSLGATEALLDRIVGKPKQSIEKKTINLSYQDLLDSIGDPTPQTINAQVIDDIPQEEYDLDI